jgi:hypothetical protein
MTQEHKISLSVTDSQTILHVKHQIREQAATKGRHGMSKLKRTQYAAVVRVPNLNGLPMFTEGCPDCIESRQRILYMGKELKDSQVCFDKSTAGTDVHALNSLTVTCFL